MEARVQTTAAALRAVRPPALPASPLWDTIRQEALSARRSDPDLSRLVERTILAHENLASALAYCLAKTFADCYFGEPRVRDIVLEAIADDPDILVAACADLKASRERNPAYRDYIAPLLYFKGFQSLQWQRMFHWAWVRGRQQLATHFQHRLSAAYSLDIHPAARMGSGIFIDHATGIVIGETAVVGDDVSILHDVTLGGTGKQTGDRHPKIGRGVLIGAGAKILGNIVVGEGAKIAAGSVVLAEVAPFTTVAGIPARPVKRNNQALPALSMDQSW
jgi:serine O-acetyltransferase